jgi:hypothetical protein
LLTKYATQEEFLRGVSLVLDAEDRDGALREALLSGIASADDDVRASAQDYGSLALNLKVGSWVIRDDDLPIIQALSSLAAAIAASLGTAGIALPSVVVAVTGLADLCWRAWRKGARLSEPQLAVYGCLAARGPMSAEAVAKCLAEDGRPMSSEALDGTLRTLGAFDMSDGRVVALVKREDDGTWKAMKV